MNRLNAATFRESCAKYFSKKTAATTSVLETTLNLCCVISGKWASSAFIMENIPSGMAVGTLREAIWAKNSKTFEHIDAKDLMLWLVAMPTGEEQEIAASNVSDKKLLIGGEPISEYFENGASRKTIHIIVEPRKYWIEYKASDGETVDLPPSLIKILESTDFAPEPRTAFKHLKRDLQAGEPINIPHLGQTPKDFGLYGRGRTLFVTKQMLELWNELRDGIVVCRRDRNYRRVLSGPMGVGKSYLAYFLAARAYAERWPILYIADAKELYTREKEESAMQVIKRFLALNKDILTAAELSPLSHDYNGKYDISIEAFSVIFGKLLKQNERKTLLIVDEHGKLFEEEDLPKKKIQVVASSERLSLVGRRCQNSDIECAFEAFTKSRTEHFRQIADDHYTKLYAYFKDKYYKALVSTFLGSTSAADFDWSFIDLGLVYRRMDGPGNSCRYHILCPPAQKALLEVFKTLPLPLDVKTRINLGNHTGDDFWTALFHHLICVAKPVFLDATDLNNKNPATIALDFVHCETIKTNRISLRLGYENVLCRGYIFSRSASDLNSEDS
ncbi:hypothetical protein BGX26_005689, partial [Mortierella sp. AD094]